LVRAERVELPPVFVLRHRRQTKRHHRYCQDANQLLVAFWQQVTDLHHQHACDEFSGFTDQID
jgi:hypothetical protein